MSVVVRWVRGQDRCEWHAGGTAAEDDPVFGCAGGSTLVAGWSPPRRHRLVGKSPEGSRQLGHQALNLSSVVLPRSCWVPHGLPDQELVWLLTWEVVASLISSRTVSLASSRASVSRSCPVVEASGEIPGIKIPSRGTSSTRGALRLSSWVETWIRSNLKDA